MPEIPEIKRLHYFTGELLVEKDFTDEQGYHIAMRRRHNHLCHGFGVVDGLIVSKSADRQVQISAGSAIDGQGREVVLVDNQSYTLRGGDPTLYLTLQYAEVLDDADKSKQAGVNDIIRWTERPVLAESATVPPEDGSVIVIARLTLKAGGVIDVIDTSTVPRAAVSAIAPGAVHEDQIVNGSVTDPKIFGVSGAKLTDNTVTDAKIVGMAASKLTGTVTDAQIAGMAASKLTGTVTDTQIAGMDGAKLTANSVSLDKLALNLQPPVSVKGVKNPGGDIDVVATNAITVSANITTKQITIGEGHSTVTTNPHQVTANQVDKQGGNDQLVAQINSGNGVINAPRISTDIARTSLVGAKSNGVLVFGQVTAAASPIATVQATTQNVQGKLVTVRGWATTVSTSSPGFVGASSSGFWLTTTGIQFKEVWALVTATTSNASSTANFLQFNEAGIATINVQITVGIDGIKLGITAAPAGGGSIAVGYAFQVSWQ